MAEIDMDRVELTDKDIRIGVWTYGDVNTEKNVPSSSLNSIPENIYELDRLWINVGAWTGLSEKEFKRHRKDWIEILPGLKNIRFLWVKGSINQDFFDVICKMEWLEALNLQGTIAIKHLDSISNLKQLKHLKIESSSKLTDMNGLSALKNLITLQIGGLKLIRDITPITKIKSLKGLHILGDMWEKQFLDSISGLDNLSNLEYLSLDGTEVITKDITPISELKKLKNLEVGYWWTKDDLNLLYNSLPSLKYGSVKEAVESGEYAKYLRKIK
jgi:Leucine-rich repeat (LRR) protein